MRRGYFGNTGEQVHYRETGEGGVPLICLSPAPHSSTYFETLMPFLAKNRLVRALDYPGYGGSDRLAGPVSIKAYADQLSGHLKRETQIDLLGFHTGNLVAAEIALACPKNVRRIIMIDVPFFDAQTRETYSAKLSEDGIPTLIEESFKKVVANRPASTDIDRAFSIWVESLRSGRYKNDAFRAAFAYDCETRFPMLSHDVTVIATQSALLEPTRKAAAIISNATLIEKLDITAPVFEAHSKFISETVNDL